MNMQPPTTSIGMWNVVWSGDRLKILVWDRDGFVLWYKRLEAGVFKLPRVSPGSRSVELRASELAMILDGIDMTKLKRVPRYEREGRTISDNKATAKV
jgi:transposase